MNTTQRNGILQRWQVVQHELMPELRHEVGALTPKLEKVIHTLEWVRIEEFVASAWTGWGRPSHDRGMLANAYVAKAVLRITTTVGLIERLTMDRALRRICGFPMWKKLPDESTFSRAFAEFAKDGLAERAHKALIRETLGDQLIGQYHDAPRTDWGLCRHRRAGTGDGPGHFAWTLPSPTLPVHSANRCGCYPWYPGAILFRQKQAGDWESVIEEISNRLRIMFPQPG